VELREYIICTYLAVDLLVPFVMTLYKIYFV